jgi:putative phosphoesterase
VSCLPPAGRVSVDRRAESNSTAPRSGRVTADIDVTLATRGAETATIAIPLGLVAREDEVMSGLRIGVVADIHSTESGGVDAPEALFRAFEGVDRIVACGDHTGNGVLERLAALAPLTATVNPAMPGDGGGYVDDESAVFDAGDMRFGVVFSLEQLGAAVGEQGEITWPASPFRSLVEAAFGGPVDALCFGGTHTPFVGSAQGLMLVNPGSPRFAARTTAAIVEIERPALARVDVVEI